MSYATLILGESGTGKTASLRNLDPGKVLLIQPIRKPLPFPPVGWRELSSRQAGNIYVAEDIRSPQNTPNRIINAMMKTSREIIIVDDWQYILSCLYMSRREEKSFDKFTDIGGAGFDIAKTASSLAPHKRVYILSHTDTDQFGKIKIKTLGRLLDDKIVVEGMFTTVLRTQVENGEFFFRTQNNGNDTVKSPMGLFKDLLIPNDLAQVDKAICAYYGINGDPTEEIQSSAAVTDQSSNDNQQRSL